MVMTKRTNPFITVLAIMYSSRDYHRLEFFLAITAIVFGLSACVPQEKLIITQENISSTKNDLTAGISNSINAAVDAISDSVSTVKNDLAGTDNEIVVAAIDEETPPPSLNPNIFLGQGRDELITSLGREDYRRLDQGVEVLQFRLKSCIIDFVMSSERDVESYHVRHRISGQPYDDKSCRLDLAMRYDAQN